MADLDNEGWMGFSEDEKERVDIELKERAINQTSSVRLSKTQNRFERRKVFFGAAFDAIQERQKNGR